MTAIACLPLTYFGNALVTLYMRVVHRREYNDYIRAQREERAIEKWDRFIVGERVEADKVQQQVEALTVELRQIYGQTGKSKRSSLAPRVNTLLRERKRATLTLDRIRARIEQASNTKSAVERMGISRDVHDAMSETASLLKDSTVSSATLDDTQKAFDALKDQVEDANEMHQLFTQESLDGQTMRDLTDEDLAQEWEQELSEETEMEAASDPILRVGHSLLARSMDVTNADRIQEPTLSLPQPPSQRGTSASTLQWLDASNIRVSKQAGTEPQPLS